ITWSKTGWSDLLKSVHEGRYDIAANGITITADRKEQVDFSDPYLVSEQRMVARSDEGRFSSAAQLGSGTTLLIGAQTGAAGFYAAAYNVLDGDEKSARIKLFPSAALAVKALLAGTVDCVLLEEAAARGFVNAGGGKLKVVGEALAREPLGLAVTPGSELTASIDAAIRSMKDDGTLERLATRWFYEKGTP
ncbi:MAG TPA: ABC transporter substrate-binding protein, partial [Spirochaetia bacterium]|nr:ABC transporter substrate-binding protein [Spirochaetia bacterium]